MTPRGPAHDHKAVKTAKLGGSSFSGRGGGAGRGEEPRGRGAAAPGEGLPGGRPRPSRTTVIPLRPGHAADVRRIHAEGIATGHATFETASPGWAEFDAGHLPLCRWVAVEREKVVGWAALAPVSSRCVYGGVAEVSVYVAGTARGRGVGRLLLRTLVDSSEAAGIWTLQAGIFPENTPSVALHRSLGFREVGRRERLGRLEGRWRDVLLLERRSRRVGVGEVGVTGAGPASGTGDAILRAPAAPPGPAPPARQPLPASLRAFARTFNAGDYWESHELLEGPWRESRSRFYQGLILHASAFVHLERGNAHGVAAQLRKAEAALAPFAPSYLGVDVDALLAEGRALREAVEGETLEGRGSGGEGDSDGGEMAGGSPRPIHLDPARIRGDEPELVQGDAPVPGEGRDTP